MRRNVPPLRKLSRSELKRRKGRRERKKVGKRPRKRRLLGQR
jgi:hypothetical protein